MTPRVVPVSPASATVTITAPLTHLCPFKDEVDVGRIELTWRCHGATFELHTLRQYLTTFEGRAISHEDLTAEVQAELGAVTPEVSLLSVDTLWSTAGMEVRCSTLPTPASGAAPQET